MVTLIQTCSQLRTGLQKVKVANQTRQEISALQQRLREWGQHVNTRRNLLEKIRIVDPDILNREEVTKSDQSVQSLVEQARNILEADGNVQDLTADSLWLRLTNAAGSANERVREEAKAQWRQLVENLGHIDAPSILAGRMIKTPSNEAILSQYQQHYSKYLAATRVDLPAASTSKSEITSAVESLQTLREQLNGNAPDSVRVFLKAVESGGAPLELLTVEVVEWLHKNDDPNRFLIKPKAAQIWR
jgi:hypothetical protein